MDEGDAERIVLWLASVHALPATDQHGHPLPAIDIKFRRGGSNSFAVLGLIGGSEDPVDSPRRSSRRRRRRHPVEEAPQAVPATPEREQLPPASPVRHARWSFLRRFRGIATVVVFVILLHFITPVMGHATIRDFDSIQLLPCTTNGDLKARDHDTFDWRERHPLRFSLLAMLQDDFPAPQDFWTDRDGSTTTPTSSPWTPRADSIGAPGGALASSTPASRSGAAPKFRRDQSHQTVAPAAAARATWVILACVPSVSSTDDDFKAGDHLAFDWRPAGRLPPHLAPERLCLPAPQDFCPDRDDHPYVVDVDSGGGLLLRGARRNAHVFCPGVALGLYPAPISGDILCDALLRMALPFPPCSDDYRLLCAGNVGMIHITAADGEHQIRLVAELQPEAGNGIHHAILLRYPQKLRVWASKEAKSPASRRPWSSDGVVALAGKLPFAAESASQACGSYSSRGHDDWRQTCIRF